MILSTLASPDSAGAMPRELVVAVWPLAIVLCILVVASAWLVIDRVLHPPGNGPMGEMDRALEREP